MSGFGRVVVLSSAVSLLAPAVAAAQDVRVGVLGGIVFSNLANLTDAVDFGASSVDVKWRTGAVVGPFVSIGVNDKLAIQPEVLFATKGATATDGINELRIQLSYVDIPILARVTPAPDKPFYFLVGPSVNFNTSATAVDLVPEEMEEDIKDDIKGTEFGLVFGAGVTIRRFLLEGRYIAGLSNIADNPDIVESVRNRGIAILAGVRF
jgi:hypothetical protein